MENSPLGGLTEPTSGRSPGLTKVRQAKLIHKKIPDRQSLPETTQERRIKCRKSNSGGRICTCLKSDKDFIVFSYYAPKRAIREKIKDVVLYYLKTLFLRLDSKDAIRTKLFNKISLAHHFPSFLFLLYQNFLSFARGFLHPLARDSGRIQREVSDFLLHGFGDFTASLFSHLGKQGGNPLRGQSHIQTRFQSLDNLSAGQGVILKN